MQPSEIISVNLWQILISLCNLLILFLLFKKFLFAPVKAFVAKRQAAVEEELTAAAAAHTAARADAAAWQEKLAAAQAQADETIKRGAETAARRGEAIVAKAKAEAKAIVDEAQAQAQLQYRKADAQMKQEMVDVSVVLAGQLLAREIQPADHAALFDAFLKDVGEPDDIGS